MSYYIKPRVMLIFGGRGHESEVSTRGAKHILPLIDREKYQVLPIFIDKSGAWLTERGDEVYPARLGGASGLFLGGKIIPIDCAFPLLHGDFGEDGVVQGALQNAGIAYVGCNAMTSGMARDKATVKSVAERLCIPTVRWISVYRSDGICRVVRMAESEIGYPMFIKPACLGSSVGASGAECREDLTSALERAFTLSDKLIIESRLGQKRELECAYFSALGREIITEPGEILIDSGFYDYDEKYSDKSCVSVKGRAELDEAVAGAIKSYSRALVRALGVRNLSRIDFFFSGERLYFNEINTMPGMTEGSLYPMMLGESGISPCEMVNSLIADGIERGA